MDVRVKTFQYDGRKWAYADDITDALSGCKVITPRWAIKEAWQRARKRIINGKLAVEVHTEVSE